MEGQTLIKLFFLVITILFIVTIISGRQNREGLQEVEQQIEEIKRAKSKEEEINRVKSADAKEGLGGMTDRMMDAQLDEAVNSLDYIASSVSLYRQTSGRWPETIKDISLSKRTTSEYLEDVRIEKGHIYGFLKPEFGAGKIIRIYPTKEWRPHKWKCTTNLDLGGTTRLGTQECNFDPNVSYTGTYF